MFDSHSMRSQLKYFQWVIHLFFIGAISLANAADKVVLQLKWEHEFQFAGFYAALWQGYYGAEGLEVEIRSIGRPDGRQVSPLDELLSGRADFAVGGSDIFVDKGKGHDLKVLAPIFQRSPAALFTLRGSAPLTLEHAAKLRLASLVTDDTWLDVRTMFFIHGIDWKRIQFVDQPVSPDTLVAGSADAIVTYDPSARFRAAEIGVELSVLDPSDYGIQFYGDILYTSGKLAAENPELVQKFLQATLKGWRYALEHKIEIADRISATLARYIYHYDDFSAYNRNFAQQIDDYIFYPVVELGHIDLNRWERTYDTLERLGEIQQAYDPESLLFKPPKLQQYSLHRLYWTATGIGLTLLLAVVIACTWRTYQTLGLSLSLLALLVLLEQGLEAWHRHDTQVQLSIRVLENLATVRSRLEQVLSRNLTELTGVAAYIAANPDVNQAEFEQYASALLKQDPQLINLAAAPNLIVEFIHPLPGNEAVLGLNYRQNKQQFPAIQRAIELNEPLLAGPVDLLQGGSAFIGRAPVRVFDSVGQPKLWGIVSAPIDVASVYREGGLLDPNLGLKIVIRGKDSKGAAGERFYGPEEVLNHPAAVSQTVSFSGGSWQISAIPSNEDSGINPRLILIRIFFLLVALLLVLLLTTRRKTLADREHYQAALKRHTEFLREVEIVAKVGGWRLNRSGNINELTQHALALLKLPNPTEQLSITEFAERCADAEHAELDKILLNALTNGERIDLELRNPDHTTWLRLIADPLKDDQGNWELVGALQDITEKKIADAKIERQANYDSLTELPNRALFYDRLLTAMARARRTKTSIAVLFVDLDQFKSINDNYGHKEGDRILQETARRIKSRIRESDTVARHSGDEFTVILQDLERESCADAIASSLIDALGQSFVIGTAEVYCAASIGIAFFPGDADTAEGLIVNADQAMYEVKKSGRNGWHFYTEEMQRKSERRHHLYNDLVVAIRDDELTIHIQPIVSTLTGKTVSGEALVRWRRSDGSWLSPAEFVPLAEETGLINQIDYLVMQKATTAVARINTAIAQPLNLSINVSPRLFQTKDQALKRWMELVNDASQNLSITVEITERLLIEESDRAAETLHQLAENGIGVAIDDFGTGYSSLSYLTRFPVSSLKIDRSFVNGIGVYDKAEALIETILAMANKLNLKVVAEGVETAQQLAYLTEQKCDYAQGYFLGRPMSVEDFAQRIQQENLSA